jgi:hypothetical protein
MEAYVYTSGQTYSTAFPLLGIHSLGIHPDWERQLGKFMSVQVSPPHFT